MNRAHTPENKPTDLESKEKLKPLSQQIIQPDSQDLTSPTRAPHCQISASLASTIITNHDPPCILGEPTSLEMLQRRAQEVLDSASQGLLAGNLADELAFRRDKMSPYDGKGNRNEPFFKHRCRYCGKVFGSDSALQIHIRSHTGERPFKCNVCGSRFTTKGNLKVHFQRHTQKFPHIQMNPNPIPEHLDKYHPPLLTQLSPVHGPPPHHPPIGVPVGFPQGSGFPGLPMYRPSLDILKPLGVPPPQHPLFGLQHMHDQDLPADLSKPPRNRSPEPEEELEDEEEGIDEDQEDEDEIIKIKDEPLEDEPQSPLRECENLSLDRSRRHIIRETRGLSLSPPLPPPRPRHNQHHHHHHRNHEHHNHESDRFTETPNFDDCSMDSKYSDNLRDSREQDQPENLSKAPTRSPQSSASSTCGSMKHHSSKMPDPVRDPHLYSSLLPRPGSNDNSWESLIEITKTSETSKLQQLVDNIENKLTDPNQCIVCHRILSCKSALQMHYRTHTGERPFRCRICGRAFTTKGNLKTHMGVHRMKPPMRTLHQCPVCHKKYSNALVLQQHIRLHTGEPTDLTLEQISAAEVRDFPSLSPGHFPMGLNPFGFPIPGLPPGAMGSESSMGDMGEMDGNEDFMDYDDDFDDEGSISGDPGSTPGSIAGDIPINNSTFPNTSIAALENQVRTITTMASQLSASGLSRSAEDLSRAPSIKSNHAPASNGEKSPCPSSPAVTDDEPLRNNQSSPTPSEASQGALDLTPRSAPHPSPPSIHSHPPMGMFPNFPMLHRSSMPGAPGMIGNALNSLAQSVLPAGGPFNPLGLSGEIFFYFISSTM